MSLLTATKTGPNTRTRGPSCGTGRIINTLTNRAEADNTASIELANLYLILDDPEWTSEAIAAELKDSGYDIQGSSVARHRRGACKCETL